MSARTGRPYSRRQAGSPGQAALRRITRRLLGTILFCSALAVAVAATAEDQRLLNAVKQGRVEVARSLLADGASPDGPVLIEACGKRTTEMLRLLLEAGADPAAKVTVEPGQNEVTPLIAAAMAGQSEAVDLLLAAGASGSIKGLLFGMELTAAEAASMFGKNEIAKKLAGQGTGTIDPGRLSNDLWWAISKDELERVASLLGMGADPNRGIGPEMAPLHLACLRGNTEIARLLLESGADIELRSPEGTTALMFGAMSGSSSTVEMLLGSGAEPDARNAKGMHAIGFSNGVDSVAGPILQASPELQGYQAAIRIEQNGTHPPGAYSGVCYHHGAPGADAGCMSSGVEEWAFTTVASNISHGAITPPECKPVELAEGVYTFTVFRGRNRWNFGEDHCYQLRSTKGEVTTLAFMQSDRKSLPEETYQVTIGGKNAAGQSDEPEEPLAAVAGGPYRTTRGALLPLDGSRSRGDIETAHWTFRPLGECRDLNSDAGKEGLVSSVVALCTINARLIVSDGQSESSDTVRIEVVERRTGWQTPVEHVAGEGSYRGKNPQATNDTFTIEGGDNVNAIDEKWSILQARDKSVALVQVQDENGPFDGWWYADRYLIEVKRQSRINSYLLPGGPPPLRGIENLYTHNKAANRDIDQFLEKVREHERHHTTCLKRALLKKDPAEEIERLFSREGTDELQERIDEVISEAEQRLHEAMDDPFEESFSTTLEVPDSDTGLYVVSGPAGVGDPAGGPGDPRPPSRCRQ